MNESVGIGAPSAMPDGAFRGVFEKCIASTGGRACEDVRPWLAPAGQA